MGSFRTKALAPTELRFARPDVAAVVSTLSIAIGENGDLPTEFRLFEPGWNDTAKGRFLFDEMAAKSVMSAYAEWGVDMMIDLEHMSLEDAPSPDPTSRDARGWCSLELREDGSLWASRVTWTPDGAARLREKRQRYVSPAFWADDSGRIVSMINIAICAMPATFGTPALVAASLRVPTTAHPTSRLAKSANAMALLSAIAGDKMDPNTIKEALDALIAGDDAKCTEILKQLLADAAGAAPADPPSEAPAEELATEPTDGNEDEEKKKEAIAASTRILRLAGRSTMADAIADVEEWRRKALSHDEAVAKLAKEREVLELAKRKENAIALTKLGAETPHTTGLATGALCNRLMIEPLYEQTARVASLLAARGGVMPTSPAVPTATTSPEDGGRVVNTPHGAVTLSAREVEGCHETGAKLEDYAANKAIRAKARGGK